MKSLPPFTPLSAARIAAGCASRFRTSSPSLSAARIAHTSGTTDTPSLSGTRGTPCRTSEAAVRPRTRRHPPRPHGHHGPPRPHGPRHPHRFTGRPHRPRRAAPPVRTGTADARNIHLRFISTMTRRPLLFVLLSLLLAALFAADLAVGSVAVSFGDIWGALTGGACDPVSREIILKIRLLKASTALLAGMALAASGLQMQTLFRNPLAGPYVLGISSGAGLGVALFLLGAPLLGVANHTLLQSLGIAGAAWLGSALVLFVIVAVSRRIKDIMVLLILGMMFGSGIGSVVEILQYLSEESALKSFVIWTMGSLGDVTAAQMALIAPVVGAGLTLSVAAIKPLNLLLLGENYARTMGLDIVRSRRLVFLSTVLLAGTVTAFCGPIGFIGLAVPHLARMLFASADHRILMPASMLTGAVLLLVCDLVAKSLAFPINTITALVGIPVVIFVVLRNRNLF